MTATSAIRKARKEYRCTEQSYHTIKVGDVYLYLACPPWHEFSRTNKWEVIRACIRCAKEFGMLNSDQRKQLEGATV